VKGLYDLRHAALKNIIYTLAMVYNFININNPDNLNNNLKVEDEVEDKENIGLAKVKGDIVIN